MKRIFENKLWFFSWLASFVVILHITLTPTGAKERAMNLKPFTDLDHVPFDNLLLYFKTLFFDMRMLNRLVPAEEMLLMFGNLAMFVPFGVFLVGMLERAKLKGIYLKSFAVGFIFSLSIESIQLLIPSRRTDIDDLILNSLGLLIGLGIYHLLQNFYFMKNTS